MWTLREKRGDRPDELELPCGHGKEDSQPQVSSRTVPGGSVSKRDKLNVAHFCLIVFGLDKYDILVYLLILLY